MQTSAGVVAGFAAGIGIAVAAMVWLRVQENVTRERDVARVAELDAKVQRLERAVARLSDQVASNRQIFAARPVTFAEANARDAAAEELKKAATSEAAIVDPSR
jgi:hypothetical protein